MNKDVFINKCTKAHAIHRKLIHRGVLQKTVAKSLGLYPSAYSGLVNGVWEPLAHSKVTVSNIAELFTSINNLSQKKVMMSMDKYLEALQRLDADTSKSKVDPNSSPFYLNKLTESKCMDFIPLIQGFYHCYYTSSFGYRIKREPLLLIRDKSTQSPIALKGNKKSHARYRGFAYFSNNHLLTVQMEEEETLTPDQFIAHFSIPPFYKYNDVILKGMSISMSNSYQPISRKVILCKKQDYLDLDAFETKETLFEEDLSSDEDRMVVNYLKTQQPFLEFHPIPHAGYTLEDLDKEIRIQQVVSPH